MICACVSSSPAKDFGHAFVARFTQIDYSKAMAFIALDEMAGDMLGVVRLHDTDDGASGALLIDGKSAQLKL